MGTRTKEDHFKTTVTSGKYINDQKLVEVLTDEAAFRVLELQEYGVRLKIENSISLNGGAFPTRGAALVNPLAAYARSVGVKVLEFMMMTDLLGDEFVNGAVGFNILNGERVAVNAKAVVLTTGGAGQAYGRTDNPARITGDGYVMAYDSGLPLIDMEFVQFWPTGSAEPGYPMYMLGFHHHFLNLERFKTFKVKTSPRNMA